MKTIILNGSPKTNYETSGSYLIAKSFVSQMEQPCEIQHFVKHTTENLINIIKDYDHVIIIAPNYIHSLPGMVIEFLGQLPPATRNQSMGLFIQSGYPESKESEIVCRYFTCLIKSLGYHLLGTVIKGECGGLAIMPNMYKKLFERFAILGKDYEQTGGFSDKYRKKFGEPYQLSKSKVRVLNAFDKISVSKIGWHQMQKKHGGFKTRLARPFTSSSL